MEPVDLQGLSDPNPCDGATSEFTSLLYQSFSNGKCEGDGNYNSTSDLYKCYTSVLGTDSFDCYDPSSNLIKFYDY